MARPSTRPIQADPDLARLQELQEASGLSIVDFAEWVLGVGESTWHGWMRGFSTLTTARRRWVRRLDRVEWLGEKVLILLRVEVRRGAIGPQHGRQLAVAKRRRQLEASTVGEGVDTPGGGNS